MELYQSNTPNVNNIKGASINNMRWDPDCEQHGEMILVMSPVFRHDSTTQREDCLQAHTLLLHLDFFNVIYILEFAFFLFFLLLMCLI